MRILIVCDFLFKYGAQQARALAQIGHDVAMLCRSHALEFGGAEDERDEWIDGPPARGRPDARRPRPRASGGCRSQDARDTASAPSMAPSGCARSREPRPAPAGATTGYPTVLTVHDPLGHPGAPELTRWENWVFRRWFRRAERFVVHGQALVDELEPIVGHGRIMVIPHGLWPRSEPLRRPESPSVLLFGRLEQYKGVEVLVEAMRLLWARRPDVKLVVAGAGDAARLVPDDPRISLIPRYISESEVETLLAEASLVALPYTQASQSGVGVLAIAAGVPVVVSDLGALPELAYRSLVRLRGRRPARACRNAHSASG